ncbi:MAG: hypothetical protein HWE12_08995 [Oceanospirillaceae bacterium]|jgi:hypothetical protein|nr:hypothetical protein [Oceanospirillaceae bacterium]
MENSLASIITLCAFALPAAVFIAHLKRFEALSVVHSLVMAFICLAIGLLFAGAMITLTKIESQTAMAACIMLGSMGATLVRVVQLRRAS